MNPRHARPLTLLLTLLLACSSLGFAFFPQEKKGKKKEQPKEEQKTDEQKKADEQPAPLFEGKGGLKSSRQTKDSAALGFNGVGPNGEIEQKVLEATPTSADLQKASELSSRKVAPDALQQFILEGQLNPQPAAKSAK
ncbi:MAG TPA: hypothetical protein VGQ94_09105 [Terriglobales bacterium]|nr:hypothetical protein [Terriglobales bacterium]